MIYPIGVQSFEELRTEGCVYIDKTALVYELTHNFKTVFLGRPRRFGKSLLMSTIQAYFEGRRDLFVGLAIESMEKDWSKHPVFHFDLNNGNYSTPEGLLKILNNQLSKYEKKYGKNPDECDPQFRLEWLIESAYEKTGCRPVVLIDEYDKPVLRAIGNPELDESIRDILKPFLGTLKSSSGLLRFVMLTGVSKFGKLSVFSDLNNIVDISMDEDYAEICGLTKTEILSTFGTEIEAFANKQKVSTERMVELLRKKYDGYRFTGEKKLVFNPYSLLRSIQSKKLDDYWFETGTPTFLVEMLKKYNYDLSEINGTVTNAKSLYKIDNITAIPLLYQTGYLTIKDYDDARNRCVLGYPNEEVESGFLDFLLPFYSNIMSDKSRDEIDDLTDNIKSGDIEAFMLRLKALFYSIPYAQDNSMKMQEDQFRNLVYVIFRLLGFKIQVESHMSHGRTDAVVRTNSCTYIFEFKVNSTPETALAQIYKNHYGEPYLTDDRSVTLIGINYSTSDRAITGWIACSQPNV